MRKGVMVMAPQHNIEDSSDKDVNIFTSELLNDQGVKMWHIGKLLNNQDVPFRQDRMSSMLHLNRNKIGLGFTSMNQCHWGTLFDPSH